eukprot:6420937-Lingulodinium_polyedra.AAC.1
MLFDVQGTASHSILEAFLLKLHSLQPPATDPSAPCTMETTSTALAATYKDFAQASRMIQDDEDCKVHQLSGGLMQYLKEKAVALCQGAGPQPVLWSYSSDATSLLLTSTASQGGPQGRVVRSGK